MYIPINPRKRVLKEEENKIDPFSREGALRDIETIKQKWRDDYGVEVKLEVRMVARLRNKKCLYAPRFITKFKGGFPESTYYKLKEEMRIKRLQKRAGI